ncbi:helix-turn-helix domain-containing protein [Burkholderia cepacia]|uniref:helix-turn-helix domain-containing protein n=1 Tax=Burkholderia cepacia TaxID=292 RepID=UPI001CF47076|nr:helix-turn-helix transcriptional regulator [Burkholderia cepacia]MCA8121261.1 helix-turn-helix domain-containing protein [Burkholderia cepacia]
MTPEQQLDFLQSANERDIGKYLAMRVRGERVRAGFSQAAFAEKAGVALRTYKRFELSGVGSIETLARILMAMGHARGFYTLFPQPKPAAQLTVVERIQAMSSTTNRSE